ncbi:MAG: HlyC/CorC family transporter [Clostridiales bacterium]|nr:HlyC/CorC family transporter [Clostridiales bacterium]
MFIDNLPYIIIMLLCLVLSWFFSAAEVAYEQLNKNRLRLLAEKGGRRAGLALKLSENEDQLATTILVGDTAADVTLTVLTAFVMIRVSGGGIGALWAALISGALLLLVGEVIPKHIAAARPERTALLAAPFLKGFSIALAPLSALLSVVKMLLDKVCKHEDEDRMSQEELLLLVDEAQQEGGIDEDEGDLLKNVIEFTDLRAEEILTHRVDLEGVEIESSKEEVARAFTETQYSRLLVYEESMDNIIGVVHQKDFYMNSGITEKSIREIMTQPLFIQPSIKISDLLKLLQTQKSHIAVVLDEYGGTQGIVTMEDILEELVGEIWDEHDEVVEDFKQDGDNAWICDCSAKLDDFSEFFGVELDAASVSLGGWVMEQLGKIAQEGDSFTYQDMTITVTETDHPRVNQIRVVRAATNTELPDSAEA